MTISTVVIAIGILCLLLAIHPFTTYPLSLSVLAKLRPKPLHFSAAPNSFALCVCAYNEENVLRAKIQNMIAMRVTIPALELLVYVDAACDRTVEVAQEFSQQINLVVAEQRQGKTHGMNTLVGMTTAEIIVFTDANVIFDSQAIVNLVKPFSDPEVGVVCGHLLYSGPSSSTAAETGSAYWRLEEKIKALESLTGSIMGADGSIFAIRRNLHCPPPADLIDDMYVSLSVLLQGSRIVRADDAIAFEEAVSGSNEEFRRKIRISCQAFNVNRALWPQLRDLPFIDLYKYVSHKLLRWLVVYFLIVGFFLVLVGLLLGGASLFAGILFILALVTGFLVFWAPARPIAKIRDVFGAFFATGIGVWRSMNGQRYQTWNPPASARKFKAPPILPGEE